MTEVVFEFDGLSRRKRGGLVGHAGGGLGFEEGDVVFEVHPKESSHWRHTPLEVPKGTLSGYCAFDFIGGLLFQRRWLDEWSHECGRVNVAGGKK